MDRAASVGRDGVPTRSIVSDQAASAATQPKKTVFYVTNSVPEWSHCQLVNSYLKPVQAQSRG
jgi:hypothetical protein